MINLRGKPKNRLWKYGCYVMWDWGQWYQNSSILYVCFEFKTCLINYKINIKLLNDKIKKLNIKKNTKHYY
jgi:hypothetical protein